MAKKRKQHSAAFKAKVALAAVQGAKTTSELASQFAVHPTMIGQWKKRLIESAPDVFDPNRASRASGSGSTRETELYEQIGRLQMELAWLKKKSALFD